MKVDKSLVEELYIKYLKKGNNNQLISNGTRVREDYEKITKNPLSVNQYDGVVRKIDKSTLSIQGNDEEIKVVKNHKDTITRNTDGSVLYDKLITLHENDLNDDKKIMEAFSANPKIFKIKSVKFNLWSVESKEKRLNNYQCTLLLELRKQEDTTLDELIEKFNNIRPYEVIPYTEPKTDNTLNLYIADEHVWAKEFSIDRWLLMVSRLKYDVVKYDVEKVNLNIIGDYLHVDNANNTTHKGTQLEVKTDAFDMVDVGIQLIITLIEAVAFVPVELHWVQGNHSRALEYSVMQGVRFYFRDNEQITFNIDKNRSKAYKVYETLVVLHHGDMPKKNIYNWAHFEYSELWGESFAWELHTGHFHTKDVNTVGGLSHTQHGIKLPAGEYARSLGYENYFNKCEAFIYSKEEGITTTRRY